MPKKKEEENDSSVIENTSQKNNAERNMKIKAHNSPPVPLERGARDDFGLAITKTRVDSHKRATVDSGSTVRSRAWCQRYRCLTRGCAFLGCHPLRWVCDV